MKLRFTGLFYALIAVAASMAFSAPASAQATTTWVSGVGDDANPCSRTAPCKTFAGAISKTAAQGEINCLDSGGFGAVTITKSITINCETVVGGVLASGTNGVNVNAGVNDVVILTGLDFEGFGTGVKAVNILQAGSVIVRNSTFRGFRGTNAAAISFTPSNDGASLTVENVSIFHNGVSGSGSGGIVAAFNVGNNGANVAVDNVRIADNGGAGISLNVTASGTGVVRATVSNSVLSDNELGIVVSSSGNPLRVIVKNSVVQASTANGVLADGAGVSLQLSDNVVTQNLVGVLASSGATVQTYGNNVLTGNGSDGSFTGTSSAK